MILFLTRISHRRCETGAHVHTRVCEYLHVGVWPTAGSYLVVTGNRVVMAASGKDFTVGGVT